MKNISDHISYEEAIKSEVALRHGIENIPGDEQIINMRMLANMIFEPLRKGLGNRPIRLTMFRNQQVNTLAGGVSNSQHMALNDSAAMDIDNDSHDPSNAEIFYHIRDNLYFDQLIWEYGDDNNPAWVHVSYSFKNRRQVLRKRFGKSEYELF